MDGVGIGRFRRFHQWLFRVPLKGGRWHIIPQLAVYTTYIPLIYCFLGGEKCYLPPSSGTISTTIDFTPHFSGVSGHHPRSGSLRLKKNPRLPGWELTELPVWKLGFLGSHEEIFHGNKWSRLSRFFFGDGCFPTFNRESLFHGYQPLRTWVDEFILKNNLKETTLKKQLDESIKKSTCGPCVSMLFFFRDGNLTEIHGTPWNGRKKKQ